MLRRLLKKSNAKHVLLIRPLEPFSQEIGHLKSFQSGEGIRSRSFQALDKTWAEIKTSRRRQQALNPVGRAEVLH